MDVLVEFLSCRSTRYCNGVMSFINQVSTQVPKTKHNLRQEKFHSTATFHSDQPTPGIATECGIQLLGAQDAQNEPHWHLITKCSS